MMMKIHKAIWSHIMGPAHTWTTIDFRRVASFAWLSTPIKVDGHSSVISSKDVGSPEITKHQVVWLKDINCIPDTFILLLSEATRKWLEIDVVHHYHEPFAIEHVIISAGVVQFWG